MTRILGVESSCDESALALLELDRAGRPHVVAELISSQVELHNNYGGVVPELAAREHLKNLPLLFSELEQRVGADVLKSVDAIGVTQGPGLQGCLLVGMNFAAGLSVAWEKPLIGVNHIEGHLFAAQLDNPDLSPPFLALIVSGGHTEIVQVNGLGNYSIIARTTDDAAGECFDKSAKLMGLPYPGGPHLAKLADSVTSSPYQLPRVMRGQPEFSFSGLKTAIAQLVKREGELDQRKRCELSHAVQSAIVVTLVDKLENAVRSSGIRTVVISGGVAANRALREAVGRLSGVTLALPSMAHCTDNAAMIALVAGMRLRAKHGEWDGVVRPRWPVENLA